MVRSTHEDGLSFFRGDRAHVRFYDILYGGPASRLGDLAFYEKLAEAGRPRVLDAACGTGRIFMALAKPGRSIAAFDGSRELLEVAEARTLELGRTMDVALHEDRLETFDLGRSFDLVIVGYYGFSYILPEDGRRSCLDRVRRHLAPGGIAVLHLPHPSLLRRAVPPHELETMRTHYTIPRDSGPAFELLFGVEAMDFDPHAQVRTVTTRLAILDGDGATQHDETSTMRYACVETGELRDLAATAGLDVIAVETGFLPGARDELVVVLGAR